jgi:hypothetical protein
VAFINRFDCTSYTSVILYCFIFIHKWCTNVFLIYQIHVDFYKCLFQIDYSNFNGQWHKFSLWKLCLRNFYLFHIYYTHINEEWYKFSLWKLCLGKYHNLHDTGINFQSCVLLIILPLYDQFWKSCLEILYGNVPLSNTDWLLPSLIGSCLAPILTTLQLHFCISCQNT